MIPLPPPKPANSSHVRPAPTNWAAIYQPVSHLLRAPTQPAQPTMRSSKSHISLKDLSNGVESLILDRTANSTPAAKHKKEASLGEGVSLIPTTNKPLETTNSTTIREQNPSHGNSSDKMLALKKPGAQMPSSKKSDLHTLAHKEPDDSGGIFLESKAEDDVFGCDSQSRPEVLSNAFTAGAQIIEYAANNTIAPRPDRLLEPLTKSNAQGVLPPDALVFVANWQISRTDKELETICHQIFVRFGPCFVNVHRDVNARHPYALIQYYTTKDAIRAIEEGHDLLIDNRRLRTEKAKCHRSVILSRIGGGPVTNEEARQLLGNYGPIQNMQPTTNADSLEGVPVGMKVEFAYYLDYKDCLKAFNSTTSLFEIKNAPHDDHPAHPSFSSDAHGGPFAPDGLSVPGGFFPPVGPFLTKAGLQRSSATPDQRSIFVGHLPEGINDPELKEIYSRFGEVKGAVVVRKPIHGPPGFNGFNIFGFVEYNTADEAARAVNDHKHISPHDIHGHRVRVEPKQYTERREAAKVRQQQYNTAVPPPSVPWGRPANAYQSPHTRPQYVYHPMFTQTLPQADAVWNPAYAGWFVHTPPRSAARKRTSRTAECFMGTSPSHQFVPMQPGTPVLSSYPNAGLGDQRKLLQPWRQI